MPEVELNKASRVASSGGRPAHFNGTADNGVPTTVNFNVDTKQRLTTSLYIQNVDPTNFFTVFLDGGTDGYKVSRGTNVRFDCEVNEIDIQGDTAPALFQIVITF